MWYTMYHHIRRRHPAGGAYQYELLRVGSSATHNNLYLSSFSSLVTNYSSSLSDSKLALNAWTNSGASYSIPYQAECTGSDKDRVTTLIGDTSGSSSASLYSASALYTQLSDNRVAHLADYAVALNDYNAEYLSNKTKSLQRLADSLVVDVSLPHIAALSLSFDPLYDVLDEVVDCVSLNNGTCSIGIGARDLFDEMNVFLSQRIVGITNVFNSIRTDLMDFSVILNVALIAMNQFYDSVAGVQGILAWVVKNTGGLFSLSAQLCGRATPNWCDFSPSDWFMIAPDVPDVPLMPSLTDADVIWDAVKEVVVEAKQSIASAADLLEVQLNEMVAAIETAIAQADFTPDDYNPPAYPAAGNYSTEREQQASSSSEFLAAMQDIINAAQNINTSYFDSTPFSSVNISASSLSSSALSSFSTSWSSISFGGINIATLLASISTIQGLLYLFDYMYRVFQSVRLFSKFWSRGVIKTPVIDNRITKDAQKKWTYLSYLGYALQILPFVWLQLLILIFLVALLMWSIAGVLVPEYYGYMATCVDHTQNGTFVSRTMDAVAYNYASMDGNADVTKGILQYNAQLVGYCAINALSTSQTYDTLVSSMLTNNQTLQSEITKISAVQSCVDLPAIDALFASACCGQSGFYNAYWSSLSDASSLACPTSAYECPVSNAMTGAKFLPPGSYLNKALAQYATTNGTALLQFTSGSDGLTVLTNYLGEVQNSVFQCSVLPTCELECAGPDESLLYLATKNCSCMAEWYFNGYVLQISIAIIAYVLMNVSRGLVMGGLLKIFWKSLAPKIFEVTSSCDGQGLVLAAEAAAEPQSAPLEVVEGTRISSGKLLMSEKDRLINKDSEQEVIPPAVRIEDEDSRDCATVSSDGSGSDKNAQANDNNKELEDDEDGDESANDSEMSLRSCRDSLCEREASDDDGDDDLGKEHAQARSPTEIHVSAQIGNMTRGLVRSGYREVLLGILLNAPWMALVYLTRQDMSYDGQASQ
eukprot:gene22699-28850_t